MSNIEKKLYDVKDSIKMGGVNDRLEKIVRETKASAGIEGMRALSDEELDLVAGGVVLFTEELDETAIARRSGVIPRGGLQC